MTPNMTLLELADRIEGLSGADRACDAEIAAAIRHFPKGVGFVWQESLRANSPEVGRVECCTGLGTGGPHYAAPKFTASIDAAVSLVPEGWNWGIGGRDLSGQPWAWVDSGLEPVEPPDLLHAASPSLALCLAALRGRAHQNG